MRQPNGSSNQRASNKFAKKMKTLKKYLTFWNIVMFAGFMIVCLAFFDVLNPMEGMVWWQDQRIAQSQQYLAIRTQEAALSDRESNTKATEAERVANAARVSSEAEASLTLAEAEAYRIRTEADTASAQAESLRMIAEGEQEAANAEVRASALALTNNAQASLIKAQTDATEQWVDALISAMTNAVYATIVAVLFGVLIYYLYEYLKDMSVQRKFVLEENRRLISAQTLASIEKLSYPDDAVAIPDSIEVEPIPLPDWAEREIVSEEVNQDSLIRTLASQEIGEVKNGVPFEIYVNKEAHMTAEDFMLIKGFRKAEVGTVIEIPTEVKMLMKVLQEMGATETNLASTFGLKMSLVRSVCKSRIEEIGVDED